MLIRTHVVVCLFFVLLFLPSVEYQLSFFVLALISTIIPDVDSRFSKLGKKKIFRPLQFFVSHRGFLHSFIFLFFATLFFATFFSYLAFPFFLGYGIHLLSDSFTIKGIKPFYPYNKRISGFIKTGGRGEVFIFIVFLFGSLALLFKVVPLIL